MILKRRTWAGCLAALAFTALAGPAPAVATNSGTHGTQPPGPPLYSGNPASVPGQTVVGHGAAVLHCNSPSDGGAPGVYVDNINGVHSSGPAETSC